METRCVGCYKKLHMVHVARETSPFYFPLGQLLLFCIKMLTKTFSPQVTVTMTS